RAEALPAPSTMVRPLGRSGSRLSNLPSGSAASSAASNSLLSTCSASRLSISSAASIARPSLTPRSAPLPRLTTGSFSLWGAPLLDSGDLVIGLDFQRPDQGRVIPSTPAMGGAGAEQLLAERSGRQRNIELAG